ncbi:DUF1990 family protein [Nocardioides halotolerans]|uniref:DUF1990 family protein n=1 Tax=Nocardioides halotolerans TaxID=433660 RepID=UPI000415F02C|nr:DUF1990 domain-containing protein [Nocardioides halotolerans]
MAVGELPAQLVAMLRAAPFTYDQVGATASDRPAGYDWLERSAPLVRRDFEGASTDLFMWRLHERAGLRVQTSESPLRQDTVVLMHLGLGPASVRIPCRVAYVIKEPTLRGFAYGTLPGHPESGEERFVLEQHGDGSITIAITAFSHPASRLATLGGPFTRRVQQLMTSRYLRALDRP